MWSIVRDPSRDLFLNAVGSFLYPKEAMHGLLLGLAENGTDNPSSALLLRILKNGVTVSAALQAPPHNLVLANASQEALQHLAEFLLRQGAQFPGVVGPVKEAETFAEIWASVTQKQIRLAAGQKIYQAEEVRIPDIPGELIKANASQTGVITEWLHAFMSEAMPSEMRSMEEDRKISEWKIQKGYAYLWMADGEPVSTAHVSRPTKNGISVCAVFTPKNLRKRGYASAAVAHLSQEMLNTGRKFCSLYTDLSNPTSNKIYQEIGYKEVSDSKHFQFF